MRRAALVLAAGMAVALSVPLATEWGNGVNRLGLDLLLPLVRWTGIGLPPPSRVAVIGIDEETYATAPFAGLPKVAWTPQLAEVIAGAAGAGAAAIGLDMVFSTTLDTDDLVRNLDRRLLQTLLSVGRQQGKLVMGEISLSEARIQPTAMQQRAVGSGNLRLLNQLLDGDDVVRRSAANWATEDGGRVTSFAAELARRAGGTPPAEDFLIRSDPRPGAIPTYSFADIFLCRDPDFLARAFAGRVVLIAEVLDVEDRRLPASRFAIDGRPEAPAARCATETRPATAGLARTTIPGVYLHGMAVDTILAGSAPRQPGPAARMGLGLGSIALTGTAAAFLAPPLGLLVWLAAAMAIVAGTLGAYALGWLLPFLWLVAAPAVAMVLVYAWRFVVEDREKRRIQRAFRHYLAPALVEKLAQDAGALKLGGERRRVAVFFSDIAGFTAVSEKLRDRPEVLVAILNAYTTVIAEVIETHGGYVDKFIGDSVMAMWNAPLADDDADRHAVSAALDCLDGLARFNAEVLVGRYGLPPIGTRIGINSGVAIVGNMGSTRRFNYTVTGDVVNLAARLESANKAYGTTILIGEATARGCGRDFLLQRVDRTVVKGKSLPVKIYQPAGRTGQVPDDRIAHVGRFHAALGLFLRRRFAEAEAAFAALAPEDATAALYAARARHYRAAPPPARWDRAWTLESK